MEALRTIFPVLIGISLLAVLVVLVVGITAMLRGGAFNRRHGNSLMRLRVLMQGIAVALMLIYVAFVRGA